MALLCPLRALLCCEVSALLCHWREGLQLPPLCSGSSTSHSHWASSTCSFFCFLFLISFFCFQTLFLLLIRHSHSHWASSTCIFFCFLFSFSFSVSDFLFLFSVFRFLYLYYKHTAIPTEPLVHPEEESRIWSFQYEMHNIYECPIWFLWSCEACNPS